VDVRRSEHRAVAFGKAVPVQSLLKSELASMYLIRENQGAHLKTLQAGAGVENDYRGIPRKTPQIFKILVACSPFLGPGIMGIMGAAVH
jgi:hypothetical protein